MAESVESFDMRMPGFESFDMRMPGFNTYPKAVKRQEDRAETSHRKPDQGDDDNKVQSITLPEDPKGTLSGADKPHEVLLTRDTLPEDRAEILLPWADGLLDGREVFEWEALWERLLPVDYEKILSRAVDPVEYSFKKELYFRLHQPLLLDRGTKSFALDMATNKICYTLSARALRITHGSNPEHWKWVHHPDSRFAEVAELKKVFWLNVDGKINSSELSPKTTYAAYLVFKLPWDPSFGFAYQTQKAQISIGTEKLAESIVRIEPRGGAWQDGQVPTPRKDGWMELYLGKFDNHEQMSEEIGIAFMEVEILEEKNGLIVEGIEVRPDKQ